VVFLFVDNGFKGYKSSLSQHQCTQKFSEIIAGIDLFLFLQIKSPTEDKFAVVVAKLEQYFHSI